MRTDIIDIDQFIKKNEIQPVTNPGFLTSERTPTDDGLFSYTTFGSPGSVKRKAQFGYIDLGKPYFHPLVYLTLKQIQRNILTCIDGTETFSIDKSGELVKDPNGSTGINFLYKNWESIKFKRRTDSSDGKDSFRRLEKINFLRSLKKNEVFITKQLVLPAFFRDMDWTRAREGVLIKDEINEVYATLISLASPMVDKDFALDFSSNIIDHKIQLILVDIYDRLIIQTLPKKTGMIKKNLLGKTVDYSVRLVISMSDYTRDSPIDYEHVGIPLPYTLVLFYPFILRELTSVLTNLLENNRFIDCVSIDNPTSNFGIIHKVEVHKDAYLDFTVKELERRLKLFIRNSHSRLDPIMVKTASGKYEPIAIVQENYTAFSLEKKKRRMYTWTDLLYELMTVIADGKHVYVTRYPMDSVHNMFPAKVGIITIPKTIKLPYISGGESAAESFIYQPDFPLIDNSVEKEKKDLYNDSKKFDNPKLVYMISKLPNGDIAAIKDEKNKISLPGGLVQEGESPLVAIARISELLGWKIVSINEKVAYKTTKGTDVIWYFYCMVDNIPMGETSEGGFSPATINQEVLVKSDSSLSFIKDYLEKEKVYLIDEHKVQWLDSMQLASAFLLGMNGDFDGDTVSVRSVFTKEANLEAHNLIRSPKMLLSPSGGTIRSMKNEGVLALYALTVD